MIISSTDVTLSARAAAWMGAAMVMIATNAHQSPQLKSSDSRAVIDIAVSPYVKSMLVGVPDFAPLFEGARTGGLSAVHHSWVEDPELDAALEQLIADVPRLRSHPLD